MTIQRQTPFSNKALLYPSNEPIKDSYIVVLKDNITKDEMTAHINWITSFISHSTDFSLGIEHLYDIPTLFKGYAGTFDHRILDVIRKSNQVAYIEQDAVVHTMELQRRAPWGLARLSTRKRLTIHNYDKYYYNMTGEGIHVYVIDTGIYIDHHEFEGRAKWGVTVPRFEQDIDGNGHGTHCAGVVAGKTVGVAKKARPIAVKVLKSDGSGKMSDVIKGVDWAVDNFINRRRRNGAVANMSLGGGKSRALDDAINQAVNAGLLFVVAAGNSHGDACRNSPSGAEKAITVGATNIRDQRAPFSNFGRCVDLFAPGMNILSTWNQNPESMMMLSGTSMASPHVAGLAAYLLDKELKKPELLKDQILQLATDDSLSLIPDDTPNLLAFNGYPDI